MKSMSSTALKMPATSFSTRLAKRPYTEWRPHAYQRKAVEFISRRSRAALFLDPGLGKTSIVLSAFSDLLAEGRCRAMLVVAPLRVCQLVWRQEGEQWEQFRHLRFALLHGSKKDEAAQSDADVYLINPEGLAWLHKHYHSCMVQKADVLCIDELTKFKNAKAQRHKLLRSILPLMKFRWGLTGTPAPNGYMDLFGQMLILDEGKCLGRYITHYRDRFFNVGRDGFTYTLREGSAARIEEAIKPLVLRMSAEDYLDLPPLIDDVRRIALDKDARKLYDTMKRDELARVPDGVVTAANAAAVYSKLAQMANGRVYIEKDGERVEAKIHTAKLEALEELIDELQGQQLLIAYEFQHDAAAIKEYFGERVVFLSGASEKRVAEIERQWNAGEIQILAVHPASAGHGLNLQKSGASHMCWYSVSWDLELYEQFIRRVHRQGNPSDRVFNHLLIVEKTLDSIKLDAIRNKSTTQANLLSRLNEEILLQDDGRSKEKNIMPMLIKKMPSKEQAESASPWNPPAPTTMEKVDTLVSPAPATFTEEPAEHVTPPEVAEAFGGAIAEALTAAPATDDPLPEPEAKPKRGRKPLSETLLKSVATENVTTETTNINSAPVLGVEARGVTIQMHGFTDGRAAREFLRQMLNLD